MSAVSQNGTTSPRHPKARRVRIAGGPFAVLFKGDLSVVFWGTVPLYSFRGDDLLGRYAAAVDLVLLHGLGKGPVARAFGMGRRTMYRLIGRFEVGGVDALLGRKGRRMPSKIRGAVARRLLELKRQGANDALAAQRLGLSKSGVRDALCRLKWVDPATSEKPLPIVEVPRGAAPHESPSPRDEILPTVAAAESESSLVPASTPVAVEPQLEAANREEGSSSAEAQPSGQQSEACPSGTVDVDPLNRQGDRLMARLGLLEDAPPLFASGLAVSRAGILLAVPLLVKSGIFDVAKAQYGTLGPAFYGLRTCVLAFVLIALLRIKRVEGLKEYFPPDLGRIIGLDRVTEVKTLRGKLKELAARGKGLEFLRQMARLRVGKNENVFGFLYVDGHVRVYSGDRHLPKTYVMQRRLALPATTDHWVGDMEGCPVFVITAEAKDALTKMLPLILKEARGFMGDRRVTFVFDRGGWSPKLFRTLIDDNCDILTYRKGTSGRVPSKEFSKRTATIDGSKVSYMLAEQKVRLLRGKLTLRQVTVLRVNNHQTKILTSRDDLKDVEVAYRMFARWRQENFFKYMLEEYALDALVDYETEPADSTRTVPNPKRKGLNKKLMAARAAVAELERQYGAAAVKNSETERRTMRGFKIAIGTKIGRPLRAALATVERIEARRRQMPVRVAVSEALKGEAPVRLHRETKRLADTFKMVAYQTESELVALLRPHYPRAKNEGRTLIASALQSSADLTVTAGLLQVTLAPMSSPHKTRAIAAVCKQLNKLECSFPGTDLRLRFAIHQSVCAI